MVPSRFLTFIIVALSLTRTSMSLEEISGPTHHHATGAFITNEPGISRSYFFNEFRVCATDITPEDIKAYGKDLSIEFEIEAADDAKANLWIALKDTPDKLPKILAIFIGTMGMIGVTYWKKSRLLTVDIHRHSAQTLDRNKLLEITKDYFGLIESASTDLSSENLKKDNPNVEIRNNQALGRGVFATKDIKKGELIGGLYGDFREAPDSMSLPDEYRDHVMQCGETVYGVTQYMNHSCDPNCGAQGLFDFVAIKDIKAGEELTSDYAMEDDSNWVVPGGKCLCGAQNCRGEILPYSKLSQEEKEKINEHTSHWILHKHGICSCADDRLLFSWTEDSSIKEDLEKYFS